MRKKKAANKQVKKQPKAGFKAANKQPNAAEKNLNQPPDKNQPKIAQALVQATKGQRCYICKRRISHAVFQRHYDKCHIKEDDDEIVFLGQITNTVNVIQQSRKKEEVHNESSADDQPGPSNQPIPGSSNSGQSTDNEEQGEVDCADKDSDDNLTNSQPASDDLNSENVDNSQGEDSTNSPSQFNDENIAGPGDDSRDSVTISVSGTTSLCLEDVLSKSKTVSPTAKRSLPFTPQPTQPTSSKRSKENDKSIGAHKKREREPDEIDGFDANTLYHHCIKELERLIEEYGWNMPNSQTSSPQKQASSQLLSQPISASQLPSQAHMNSQQMPSQRIHYSLRFFWEIVLDVFKSMESKAGPVLTIEFWGPTLQPLLRLLISDISTQQLFLRLFLRKWYWYTVPNLAKYAIEKYEFLKGVDLKSVLQDLEKKGLLEDGFSSGTISVEEVLYLISVVDLRNSGLCKAYKIEPTLGQKEIIERFCKLTEKVSYFGTTPKAKLLKSVKEMTGECYRIKENVLQYFLAILTVYAPTQMDSVQLIDTPSTELTSNLMYTILQLKTGKINFVAPKDLGDSILGVFSDFDQLISYIKAKLMEQNLLRGLSRKNDTENNRILERVKQIRRQLNDEYLHSYLRLSFFTQQKIHLRCFTAPWVLIRCLFHGVEAAQKLKDYEYAVELLKFLVNDDNVWHFCPSSRWRWYERLALNLDTHLKRPEESLDACNAGIHDCTVGEAKKLQLQERAAKLSKRLKCDFEPFITILEPEEVTVHGRIIGKDLGDQRVNHFYIHSGNGNSQPQNPSTSSSQGNNEGIVQCSVEEIARHHFIEKEGYAEGFHTESALWHTLLRLFFHDIIYATNVPTVWVSRLQDDPMDLNYKSFYTDRQDLFDDRFNCILTASDAELRQYASKNYRDASLHVSTNTKIQWHHVSLTQILGLLSCCSPDLLHAVFRRLIVDYRNTRSGFPDLTLWNTQTKALAVVEVKGPGDALSTKQKLWLDLFKKHGVRAVVCRVIAKKHRALQ